LPVGKTDALSGARHVALRMKRVERFQQIEIEATDIHIMDNT
jgi:hypothetical protein